MSKIVLSHIDKFYGDNHVLRDINLTIEIPKNSTLNVGNITFDGKKPLTINGNVELKNVVYDFSADGIPARSSEMDLTLTNKGTSDVLLDFYLVLEN